MTKLILLGVAVVVIVWLLKRAIAGPRTGKAPEAGTPQGELVSCAHCGVNLPRAEARLAGDRIYCSEEHWRLGPRDG
jgi:uncharacterized protein